MHGVEEQEHPSYGQISISRCSSTNDVPFYGSRLTHSNYVTLQIVESKQMRYHSDDKQFAGRPIVQVRMTENQFANMITSLNIGGGTPCTIERRQVNGKLEQVPNPPVKDERRTVQNEFATKAKKVADDLQETLAALQALAAPGAKLSKAAIQELVAGAEKAVREVSQNMPFLVEQFERTADHVVTEARADIEAHLIDAIDRAKKLGLPEADFKVSPMLEGGASEG